jgi:hypothetical protein
MFMKSAPHVENAILRIADANHWPLKKRKYQEFQTNQDLQIT